jgi:formimidoylglutamate deiminase
MTQGPGIDPVSKRGVVAVPAMVNAHSHAFQRDLRGVGEKLRRAGSELNDFWGWREAMYSLSVKLGPDAMEEVAFRCYREMRAAGYGAVGEFHYLHHRPDGTPYRDPNAMAKACVRAAQRVGIYIVMIPAAYARAGWRGGDLRPGEAQRRYCDADVTTFLERVDELRAWAAVEPDVSVGIAVHSARAVPASWITAVADYSEQHGLIRHVHASEQRRELDEVRAEHSCSPVELLAATGYLGPRASIVHGTHCRTGDIALLADTGTTVILCPTTEGNLGDGYPPAMQLSEARVSMAIGSDSQVRLDPFEEARELESGARRERESRAALIAAADGDLWGELATNGRRSLGIDARRTGTIRVDMGHTDLRGVGPDELSAALVTCASSAVVCG